MQEYRPVLIPKEDILYFNMRSEYFQYTPYIETFARIDLYMQSFTVI